MLWIFFSLNKRIVFFFYFFLKKMKRETHSPNLPLSNKIDEQKKKNQQLDASKLTKYRMLNKISYTKHNAIMKSPKKEVRKTYDKYSKWKKRQQRKTKKTQQHIQRKENVQRMRMKKNYFETSIWYIKADASVQMWLLFIFCTLLFWEAIVHSTPVCVCMCLLYGMNGSVGGFLIVATNFLMWFFYVSMAV